VPLKASTVNATNISLLNGSTAVPASVSYDDATRTATLTPTAALPSDTLLTGRASTGVQNLNGTPLGSAYTFTFRTSACPCQLFSSSSVPQFLGNDTQDGRGGAGPFSYELGLKVQVTQPAQLTAIRYYRDPQETGTHVGRLWSSTGALLATANYASETASGWQQAALSTPVTLVPGQTYVVSTNFNAYFGVTPLGLRDQVTGGPLVSVADGDNGVHSSAAGFFPTQSWRTTNYFVDAVVR
jgi:hypothetical protein